jgi:hypothetical protein
MDELNGRPRARLAITERPDGAGLVIELGGEFMTRRFSSS